MLNDPAAAGKPIHYPMVRSFRAFRGFGDGSGTVNSAATSAFAGRPAAPRFRRRAWVISVFDHSVEARPRLREGGVALILPDARERGLPYVEIVTDAGNAASQRVVFANGGELFERFAQGRARARKNAPVSHHISVARRPNYF